MCDKSEHLTPDELLRHLDGEIITDHARDCVSCRGELEELRLSLGVLKRAWNPPPMRLPSAAKIKALAGPSILPGRSLGVDLALVTAKWVVLLGLACFMAGFAQKLYPHLSPTIRQVYDGWGVAGIAGLGALALSIVSSPVLVLLRNVQPISRSLQS